jgi:hypothetical protein
MIFNEAASGYAAIVVYATFYIKVINSKGKQKTESSNLILH